MNPLFTAWRLIYPVSCVLIPCIIYQLVRYKKWDRDHTIKLSKGNLAWRYALILYLFMVMRAVGIGSIWDITAYGLNINRDQINLIPFASGGVTTYILNIILFMPLGFLLPFIWGKYRAMGRTALVGFLFSLAIELGQLFNHRLTDIDDIMMNSLGAVAGFSIWYILHKLRPYGPRETNIFPDSPLPYLILALLGSFFLYHWRLAVLIYR